MKLSHFSLSRGLIVPALSAAVVLSGALLEDRLGALPAAEAVAPKADLKPIEVSDQFNPKLQVGNGTEYFKTAKYVGHEACQSCHAKEVAEWKKTWHAKMEQWPTEETVIGDFNDKIITYEDIEVPEADGKKKAKVTFQVKAFKKDGGFYFTVIDKDNEANSQTYKIAKTLGGKWDQGYEILIGDNYWPAILRYSAKQNAWLVKAFLPEHWVVADGTPDGRPRKPEELLKGRVAEAKCAGCHTTGFDYKKDDKSGLWKAVGNGELGVGCEKCHGPAGNHVKNAEAAKAAGRRLDRSEMAIVHGLKDLDFNQQTQLCAQCHGRSTNRNNSDLAFPVGYMPGDTNITEHLVFWTYQGNGNPDQNKYFYRNDWAKRNRQQWQDFVRSTHFTKGGQSCLTCHNFHGKTEDMQLRQTPQAMCTGCHTAQGKAMRPQTEMFLGSKMEEAGVRCIDCHMARIGFRSHLTDKTKHNKHYPTDGSSHIFLVPTPLLKTQYGVRSACDVCHTKDQPLPSHIYEWIVQRPMSNDQLHDKLSGGQAKIRGKIDDVRAALGSLGGDIKGQRLGLVEKARSNLNMVVMDGSLGFHNFPKSEKLLDEALKLALQAGAKVPPAPQVAGMSGAIGKGAPAVAGAQVRAVVAEGPVAGAWYVSRTGDTLGGLSRTLYGRPELYPRIFEANRERLSDPNVLVPGTRIWLPAK